MLGMARPQRLRTTAVTNAATAWLYGACAGPELLACSCIGERTGNVPLEAMVFEYAALRGGSLDGMDPTVITEIADYFQKEIGYEIPVMTPFVGRNFNMTKAGIHADGLLKDEEIYNIFNTRKLLNRKPTVQIGKTSGLAGIAYWINENYNLPESEAVSKRDPLVEQLKQWIDAEYEGGRQTTLSTHELETKIERAVRRKIQARLRGWRHVAIRHIRPFLSQTGSLTS